MAGTMRHALIAGALVILGLEVDWSGLQVGTDLVTVPLSVTETTGARLISDFTVKDFRLFEDGEERMLAAFSRERQPLSLCSACDYSLSVKYALDPPVARLPRFDCDRMQTAPGSVLFDALSRPSA